MRRLALILISSAIFLILNGLAFAASPTPSVGKNGMVVASETIAAAIGLETLKSGGNAIDAAIATLTTLNVTESYNSGMGGGCFFIIYLAETGEVFAIDGRETAPRSADRDMYIDKKENTPIPGLSTESVTSSATPGQAAAIELIHKKWGTKSWPELLQPAIAIADTGFFISRAFAERLLFHKDRLAQYPSTKEIFFPQNDSLPFNFGDKLIQKDLARFLDSLAAYGADWVYNSRFTKDIVDFVRKNNGYLSTRDFESYKAVIREPVKGNYRGYDVYSMPPPSSGGIHVVQILEMFEPFNLGYWGAGSSESLHLQLEAMKRAFADRAYYLGDPDFTKVPIAGLLDSIYLAGRSANMKPYTATVVDGPGEIIFDSVGQTTHFSIIDSAGNMVAVTASLNTSFGSGVIVPGYGILLNNHMDDFSVQPGAPNFYGLVGSEANSIAPGKRPLSSMSPTILLKDGKPAGIFGSPGGPRIITTVTQTIINAIDYGMNIQEAVDFPRVHHQWKPDVVFLEQDIPYDVIKGLQSKNHKIYPGGYWSSAQCIWFDIESGYFYGGTDSRSEGAALGY